MLIQVEEVLINIFGTKINCNIHRGFHMTLHEILKKNKDFLVKKTVINLWKNGRY